MRLGWVIAGILVTLMGVGWALQGAWVLPATFMRGPEWIAIGSGLALVGLFLLWVGLRGKPRKLQPETVTSTES